MTQKVGKQLRFSLFWNVAPRNIPEERRHHLHHGKSLKSVKTKSSQVHFFGTSCFSTNVAGYFAYILVHILVAQD